MKHGDNWALTVANRFDCLSKPHWATTSTHPRTLLEVYVLDNVERDVIDRTARWIREFVIELNLCPFARREWERDSIRYRYFSGNSRKRLLAVIAEECRLLDDRSSIETSFIVLPHLLHNFLDFNDFLEACERFIDTIKRTGIYQIASFHPSYQFAGTDANAPQNFTNRSPYPMLHLLREASVERAVKGHPDVHSIPDKNIATLDDLGVDKLMTQLATLQMQNT